MAKIDGYTEFYTGKDVAAREQFLQLTKAFAEVQDALDTAGGAGDALVANNLDQFADVTQTAGQTLAITSSTTLSGGTHSGTNTGDSASEAAGSIATHAALPDVHHARSHTMTGTSDHTGGNWKVLHSNGSGQWVEVALGASETVLRSNGASSAPTFANPYGKGFNIVPGVPSGIDDTAVLQAAITASGADSTLYLPSGVWLHGPLSFVGTGGLRIIGAGRLDSILQFVPTADGQVGLTIDRGAPSAGSPSFLCSIESIGLKTADTGYDKTALQLVDTAEVYVRDVAITGFIGAGTDSIGLWTQGRESLWVDNLYIQANIPIRIGGNPNTSNGHLSADHFTFHNIVLDATANTAGVLHKACVLVDPTAQVSQLNFTGSQAWLCGSGDGFWWDQVTGGPYTFYSYSSGLRFENVRTEQMSSATSWSIYANCTSGYGPRNLSIRNCELDEGSEGVYVRYADTITIQDTLLTQATGRKIVDVDNFRSMVWSNVRTLAGAGVAGSVTVGSATKQWFLPETAVYDHPHNAIWGVGSPAPVLSTYTGADPGSPVNGQLWLRTDL